MLKVHERDVLLVTGDRSWEVVSGIQEYIDLLEGRNLNHVRIRSKLPRLDLLESELPGIRKFQPQAIVAIGGGKVIDCGKIIAGLTNCSDEPLSAIKAGLVGTHVVPIVAAPTTAGSGSEATQFAVVYDGGRKYSYDNIALLPRNSLLSIEPLGSLPRVSLVSSSLDATCQAIESIWSRGATPESTQYAKEALEILWPRVRSNSFGEEHYQNLITASNLSGRAINISRTTAPHALSYGLTAEFGVPHGLAVAAIMPYFLDLHRELAVSEPIRKILGGNMVEEWHQLISLTGMGDELLQTEISDNNISQLLNWVNEERLENNPIPLNRENIVDAFLELVENIAKPTWK
jgi:alcohol dehydrogenase class IV|tara:strand:+ start:2848 stop:3888 length:1041 start_codon:yes stop_codon:yes gene_type:complete